MDNAALFVDAPVEEGHGARAAQRVAMLLPDGPAWAATFFAALKLGAVAVPLNLPRTATGKLQRFRLRDLARPGA